MKPVKSGSKSSTYPLTIILVAAVVLLLISWGKSYPLHQESTTLPFLNSIYWTYWVAYLLFAISFWWIAATSNSIPAKWGATVGFFTLMNSLAYFYYYIPGPDTFFRNLAPAYFSGGFIYSPSFQVYPWSGFFLLYRMMSEVIMLPLNVTVAVFYFGTGFVVASMLFFIAMKHGFDGFWSVVTYSLIGFFFLDYQFAPQTLALAFVMMLLYLDYSRGESLAGTVTVMVIVLVTALSHAFMLAYYAIYILIRTFQDRRYLITAIFTITLALVSDMFLSFSVLSGVTAAIFNSIQLMLGFVDYGRRITSAVASASPFVGLVRLSVLSATAVSALGLAHLLGKRKTFPQDVALFLASVFSLGVGAAVQFFGTRAFQLALVVAGLGTGHFPKLLHNHRVSVALLLLLSISSVFSVTHLNYNPLLYQNQEDASAASFLSSRIQVENRSWSNSLRIFTPYIVRGYFGLSDRGNASINVLFTFDRINSTSMAYVIAPIDPPAFSGSADTYFAARNNLTSRDNIMFSYGDGVIYAAT